MHPPFPGVDTNTLTKINSPRLVKHTGKGLDICYSATLPTLSCNRDQQHPKNLDTADDGVS